MLHLNRCRRRYPVRGFALRATLALVAAAAFLVLPAGAGRLRAQEVAAESQGAEIREVSFEGAHAFPRAVLQAAIETAATSCTSALQICPLGWGSDRQLLDLETLRADVLRLRLFYYQRGYREAKVEVSATPKDRGVHVAFQIDEGRPIRVGSLEVLGADTLLPRSVVQELDLQRGRPFGTLAFEAARDTLTARLADRGYPHAEVLASYDLPRDTALASVRYELVPGPLARIGVITVTGTKRVAPDVVRRMLTFGPGDVYRQEELLKSQRNLFGLELFRHVNIQPDLAASPDSLVPVTVEVAEGDLHRVRFGAGINTAEAFNAEGRWTARSFMGGARRLELRARISNLLGGALEGLPGMETKSGKYALLNGSLTADFLQPRFFAPNNTLGAGLFLQRQSLPDVFVQTSRGAYFTLNRNLGGGAAISIGYRPELTELVADDDRIFCQNLAVCDEQTQEEDIRALSTPHWLAPWTLSFTRDHSNALFAPTTGSILRLDGEYAAQATGSEFAYWRLVAELSEYRQVLPGIVFAARVRPGFARSLAEPTAGQGLGLHPQKRFFAGGPNSVRGFAQYQLGPKVLTIDAASRLFRPKDQGGAGCTVREINTSTCDFSALPAGAYDARPVGGGSLLEGNFELRFPLGAGKLRGATFVDYGQLWSTPSEFQLRGLVWTPGLGVRYFSAIGPIRVDVGYNPQGSRELDVLSTGVRVRGFTGVCEQSPEPGPDDRVEDCGILQPVATKEWPPSKSFWDHLQLHFSIGQAF